MKALLFIFLFSSLNAFGQKIGSWADHLFYRNVVDVTVGGDKIYAASQQALFAFDKRDNSISRISKATGLSDISDMIPDFNQKIKYHDGLNLLLIAYTNGNIDIYKEGLVNNIPDIKNAIIVGEKRIQHIYFDGDLAYLSTSFGIVVVNLAKNEIKDTYEIGPGGIPVKIYSTTTHDGNIYAASASGVYRASLINGDNLKNFANWTLLGPGQGLQQSTASGIITFDNSVYSIVGDTVYRQNGIDNWSSYYFPDGWTVRSWEVGPQNLVLTEIIDNGSQTPDSSRIGLLSKAGQFSYTASGNTLSAPFHADQDTDGTLWIADIFKGLVRYSNGAADAFYPNGPESSAVFDMVHDGDFLWVAPGAVDAAYNYRFIRDGFFSLTTGFWWTYNQFNTAELNDMFDFIAVASNKRLNELYMGSFYGGIVKLTESGIELITKDNSSLQAPTGDPGRTTVAGLAVDDDDNLWVANFNVPKPLTVIMPDNTSKAFSFPGGVQTAAQIVIDDYNQKWVATPRNGSSGLVVYNHGEDIINTSDDFTRIMRKGAGSGNLQSNAVYSLAKDLDGDIWVGTDEGIAIFTCPGNVFFDGCDAIRPLVDQDGVLGYLLQTEFINSIAVDGANRKWVGTNNGAFLISESGEEQLQYFSKKNSPLFSDIVLSIEIDGKDGIVYFGTDKGIIAYKGDATEGAENAGTCNIYPNPVRPEYSGPITIDGIYGNSTVKITDVSGTMIYETVANGGRVIWDGNNYNGVRAKTGVYLIFLTDSNGTQKDICKLLIVN